MRGKTDRLDLIKIRNFALSNTMGKKLKRQAMSQEEILQATYLTESNIKEYVTPKAQQLKKNKESHQKTGK